MQLSFLEKFLRFDPQQRPTAEKALEEPLFDIYHNITDEPVCHQHFDFCCFESKVTCEEVKQQVVEIIDGYHRKKTR